jgi:hypothetical protein
MCYCVIFPLFTGAENRRSELIPVHTTRSTQERLRLLFNGGYTYCQAAYWMIELPPTITWSRPILLASKRA